MGVTCALGSSAQAVREAMWADHAQGVALYEDFWSGPPLHLGLVNAALPDLSAYPKAWRSRNNALLLQALQPIQGAVEQAVARYGAARVGVVLGTSTSGIGEAELAWRHRHQHGVFPEPYSAHQQKLDSGAEFLAHCVGAQGPSYVISTACSSSAKAMAAAARWLQAGWVDAVLCGGADSLCQFTVAGFSALDSIALARCNPMSAQRCGINIGEAAALFLMTREAAAVRLSGWGESTDAHHISAPDPSGAGAIAAMRAALQRAALSPVDIDYLNLHGTATVQNDAMESLAVAEVLGTQVWCSSTKPLTGHTLGAAGALEAALCWLALKDNPTGQLLPHHWDGVVDASLPALRLVEPGSRLGRAPRHLMSNSFAFGGSNAALIFSHDA
ncbi:beta-ketoacyl-ACP synthase [Roseateles sp. BYS180W]|uniref:Beta-ketoacyl-ACP synthase n=1 Tax=Roseateles rivi TaxID=3299028 RepID=A0ABW7FQX2_9BURK